MVVESLTCPRLIDNRPGFIRDRIDKHSCYAIMIAMALLCPDSRIDSPYSWPIAFTVQFLIV